MPIKAIPVLKQLMGDKRVRNREVLLASSHARTIYILILHNNTCHNKVGVVYGDRGGDRKTSVWGMGKAKQYQRLK